MANPRFFIDEPDEFFAGRILLPAKAAKHAGRSLRLASGEIVDVFNGRGRLWRGPIGFSNESAWVDINEIEAPQTESPLRITLLQSFVSPEKTENAPSAEPPKKRNRPVMIPSRIPYTIRPRLVMGLVT